MKNVIRVYVCMVLSVIFIASAGFAADVEIGELVDQYKHATDLQRAELEKNFLTRRITGSGIVENVGEYNFFDINTDTGEQYYKVTTRQQETANKTPYQVVFLYKDKDKVRSINKGEEMKKDGTLINIIDERLQISVWIYEDELTAKDRQLFNL